MKKAILTIEDCNALSYLITSVLSKDYAVTSVETCVDAIRHLHGDYKKDLIILDISDSASDNFELLEHMSTSSVLGKIPTVVISNSDDETLRKKTVQLGASLFLTKPFDPVYLSDRVKDLVYQNSDAPVRKRKTVFNLNIF
jgi:CheY-like chemotaxis protein